MPSCDICLDLCSQASVSAGELIIRQNLRALRSSANNGCLLCAILEGMDQMGILCYPDIQDHQIELCITVKSGRNVKMTVRYEEPGLTGGDGTDLEFYTEFGTWIREAVSSVTDPIDAPTTQWSVFGPATTIPETLDLHLAIGNIQSWLDECMEDHTNCTPAWTDGRSLPRRVLDLDSHDDQIAARLMASNGLRAKYVALSHCWGEDPSLTLTTTAATIRERQSGIRWEQLPKTFRDAVLITKGLGIRYLWIDSLCIIQEDMLDWEEESAKMASTYSNCYLNLAATHACNGTGGCLSRRWTPNWFKDHSNAILSKRRPVISQKICVRGEATGVFVRNSLDVAHAQCTSDLAHDFPLDQMAPLLSRAWCYQERLLSPRTVHFHSSEMIWHCMEAVSCECGSLDNTMAVIEYLGRSTFPKYTFRLLDTDDESDDSHHSFQVDLWLTMVHQYSKMRLTHSDDILPALGGVALRFKQRVNPGRYLAGLWEYELAICLLWQVYSNPGANPSRTNVDTRRPARYRAPTWSWASIDFDPAYRAAISYYEVINYDIEIDPDFLVVNASVDLAGSNEFGRVLGGMLQLRCRVVHGVLDGSLSMVAFQSDQNNRPRASIDPSARGFPKWHEVNLDCPEHLPLPTLTVPSTGRIDIVECLIVAEYSGSGHKIALVVKELKENPGTFERIGYLKADSDLFEVENAGVKVVTIV